LGHYIYIYIYLFIVLAKYRHVGGACCLYSQGTVSERRVTWERTGHILKRRWCSRPFMYLRIAYVEAAITNTWIFWI